MPPTTPDPFRTLKNPDELTARVRPQDVKARARELPSEPGVYRFLDGDDDVLYVGMASRLCERVGQYAGSDLPARKRAMVEQAVRIDAFATTNERESLILENTLIKRHRPPYNVILADDKTHAFIALTREPVPRIFTTRNKDADAEVFGPFPSDAAIKHLVRAIREAFGIRDCRTMLPQGCIKHDLGLCLGPCFRPVTDEYAANVAAARRLLKGEAAPALAVLQKRMEIAAGQERFEEAAAWRDRMKRVEAVLERQAVFTNARRDRDAIGLSERGSVAVACIVHERDGRVIGKDVLRLLGPASDAVEAIGRVLSDHYAATPAPPEIVAAALPETRGAIEELLSERAGRRVRLVTPSRGALLHLLELAEKNATLAAREILVRRSERAWEPGLDALQSTLALEAAPRRIECVDVSHLGGREVVASLAVLVDGYADRRQFRHYKISREANDDFAAMREVVTRRFTRLLRENAPLPDLLVIDGGAGQVAAAREALQALTVEVPLIGLAKRLEEIYRPAEAAPLLLPRDSPALHVLQRARDEAHRFAVRYGQALRRRSARTSPLDDVPGVGPVTKKRLLTAFGGLGGVRGASVDELAAVKGVGPRLARKIRAALGQ